ncbi:MAG: DUF3343 domain-containing protein [Oscillospiraceae bacterium]|nr:DUF3343 domain-containing protein [Oscillospiraceae bacterium]
MKACMITFRSVTPAQRGEGLLRRAGMDCSIQRTPRWMEEQGCGYSLRIRCQDVMPALEILRSNDVSFRKVYLKRENGKMEELAL